MVLCQYLATTPIQSLYKGLAVSISFIYNGPLTDKPEYLVFDHAVLLIQPIKTRVAI